MLSEARSWEGALTIAPCRSFASAVPVLLNFPHHSFRSPIGIESLQDMPEKTFTLEEAQSLLPVLESLLRQAIEGKKQAENIDAEFQEIAHRVFLNGGTFLKIVPLAK